MGSNSNLTTKITSATKLNMRRAPLRECACLIQYSGDALGRRFFLDAPLVGIGRGQGSHIMIPDDSVSREHARCLLVENTIELEDLGSSNGTFVNEKRVHSRITLRDGDVVRLGTVMLKFFAHDNIENVFHDKIYVLATTDSSTQLYNKKYLLETLDAEFKFSRTHELPLSIIYYDLDFFKNVNDAYGHSCGDFILRETSQVAKLCVRKEDVLGRFGGEEFVAVLPNTNAQTATEFAERIRTAIAAHPFIFEGKTLRQTVSIGVSENRPDFAAYTDLLDDADRKLYQSKNSGRNCTTA